MFSSFPIPASSTSVVCQGNGETLGDGSGPFKASAGTNPSVLKLKPKRVTTRVSPSQYCSSARQQHLIHLQGRLKDTSAGILSFELGTEGGCWKSI